MANPESGRTRGTALYEAHVAFELDQWRGRDAGNRLCAEVDAFWAWAQDTPLAAVVSRQTVAATAERLALDPPLPDMLATMISEIADDLVHLDINRKTRVADVVDESLFGAGVDLFIALEHLRERLLKSVLDSPVYTALASDVLYQGIKDYIFSDSGGFHSIPGVSSLIKGSTSAVNKRLPGLEAQVEKRVRAYIADNTAKTLARSEKLLLESLDEARIRAIAAEVWAASHDRSLSIADAIDARELQQLVDYGLRVWRQLRETEYVGVLVARGIQAWFERYGHRPIADLLAYVGVDRDVLRTEAKTLAPTLIEGLAETGLLEDLIRRRLEPFYGSDAFAQALAGDS